MNKLNIFDSAMDYIDENICLNSEEIYRWIYVHSGYSDADFNKFIAIATDGKLCLRTYIRDRRLYFAAKELVAYPKKPIVQIAHEYGYLEQSSFTRAMKQVYGYTPNVIRKKQITIREIIVCTFQIFMEQTAGLMKYSINSSVRETSALVIGIILSSS